MTLLVSESLRRRLRITEEEIHALFLKEMGACWICGRRTVPLVLDHDHGRHVARGILCRSCNLGLGAFWDDPVRLRKAVAYLEGSPE